MEEQAEQHQKWWQQIQKHQRTIVIAAIVFVAVIGLIILEVRLYGTGFAGKTLWDWLQLLGVITIPLVAGFGVAWFTRVQKKRDQRLAREQHDHDQLLAEQRAKSEREAAEKRAETEREIAEDNQREAALQACIDKMSELLLHEKLRESQPNTEIQNIARTRTLTILHRLDGKRKGRVLQFLHEFGLIFTGGKTIVELYGADLSKAELSEAVLFEAALCDVNLRNANLRRAELRGANLRGADLRGASPYKAALFEVIWNGLTSVALILEKQNSLKKI